MARGPVGAIVQYLQNLTARPGGDEADGRLVRRFAAAHDEAAFAAILRRHGPMVLGVCRRRLRDPHEAEDAFQAVFLVFLRKAASLRRPDRLANWLHGVARRVAARAGAGDARRRAREKPLGNAPVPDATAPAEGGELRRLLDDAVGRLPDKYRAPVVLCYLEGKTYAEAAQALGWAEGTVSGRLSRARDLLRRRLAGSGAALSVGLLTPPPAEVVRNELVKSLTGAAAGRGATAVASPKAVALAEGVVKEMFWTKLRIALATALMLAVAGAGAVAVGYGRAPAPDGPKPPAPAGPVEKVTLKAQDPDDVASILHVYKQSGAAPFPVPVQKAQLRIDFYRAGRPLKNQTVNGGLIDVTGIARKADAVRFSLQAADLDYLPLGGGEKGSCRVQLALQLISAGGESALGGVGGSEDVPKTVFDFSRVRSGSAFPASAASATEVPLFYMLANTDTAVGADAVADVLAKNPTADVAVVSLWTPK